MISFLIQYVKERLILTFYTTSDRGGELRYSIFSVSEYSFYSFPSQSVPMPHFNSPNATPQQFKRHTSMAQMNGIAEAKVWHLACNSVALYKRSFSQQKQENNFILSYTNLHFHSINSIFSLKTRIYAITYIE